ncbi:hypothetical protein PVAND_004233 [Polypedilum vanderplanki]|uniref:DNA polymerase delta subunit 3 n=1 Tax=Polypedilum vanderplanki TaxID=319348 RepID=A0A9J6BXJ1_POLVA|nr:hypothetical protein PVAND_004233 [Polypedilum vanderplanki]
MDMLTEKSCLEEISTLVFDSEQKVSLKTISNNWQLSTAIAKDVLEKWLSQNQKHIKELVKEFIVQGINSKEIFTISVVAEEVKDKLASKWKNFSSWPYSIETKSNSRSLNIPKYEPIEIKNIKINPGTRDFQVYIKTEPSSSNFSLDKPEIEVKEETNKLKRAASTEGSTKKKPANKKIKLKDSSNKKRSRIQVIDDSSEEEQNEEELINERESKFIKFDREFTPESNVDRSPQETKEVLPENTSEVKKEPKNKAKRYVTKRFETVDGFISTERVLEEYSASEDENDENKKKNFPPKEKVSPIVEKVPQQKKSTKAKAKPKEKETIGKSKQRSIMSFFSKK